jgi:hypothetical protein
MVGCDGRRPVEVDGEATARACAGVVGTVGGLISDVLCVDGRAAEGGVAEACCGVEMGTRICWDARAGFAAAVTCDDDSDGARTAKPPGLVTSCKEADCETAETWAWACEVERCVPAAMSGSRGALSSAEVSAEELVEEVVRFGLVSSVEGVRGLNCDEESRCM